MLSSHVLPEVEAVCDRMMIIDRGHLQVIGTSAELARQAQGGVTINVCLKEAGDRVFDLLADEVAGVEVKIRDAALPHSYTLFHAEPDVPLAEKLFHAAVRAGAVILEMQSQQATLEDVFRELTGGER